VLLDITVRVSTLTLSLYFELYSLHPIAGLVTFTSQCAELCE